MKEELGITNFTIGNNAQPFYITPLAPAATQPDKMLQMMLYEVILHEEPHTTYNPENPIEGEDIEGLYWIGVEDLVTVPHEDGSFSIQYKLPTTLRSGF